MARHATDRRIPARHPGPTHAERNPEPQAGNNRSQPRGVKFDRSKASLRHFERSEAQSRNLFIFLNRFLHFRPLCGPTVEMTKAKIIIPIDISSAGEGSSAGSPASLSLGLP